MSAQLILQVVLICIAILFAQVKCQCKDNVNQCFDKFSDELENHKRQTFDTHDDQRSHMCNPISGLFTQFVECIRNTESQCSSDNNYHHYVCENRKLKTKITRFTWKATFFYQLCHNTVPDLSQDFVKYEDCISTVLNTRKWKCEVNYDKPIKTIRDWKANVNTTCSLWRKFRDCSKADVKTKCGAQASVIADHLFHSHQSYFEKYYTCGLEGTGPDQCWYDAMRGPTTTTSVSTSATETTNNNIGTDQSPDLMTINDIEAQTQSAGIASTAQTVEALPNEESHTDRDQQSITKINSSEEQSSNDVVVAEESGDSSTVVSHKQISDENLEQLISSAATLHDQFGAGYVLLIPIILLLFIRFIVN